MTWSTALADRGSTPTHCSTATRGVTLPPRPHRPRQARRAARQLADARTVGRHAARRRRLLRRRACRLPGRPSPRCSTATRDRGAVTNAMTMLHLLLLDQLATGRLGAGAAVDAAGSELTATHHNELFRYQFIAYDGLRAAAHGRRRHRAAVCRRGRRLGRATATRPVARRSSERTAALVALGEGDYDRGPRRYAPRPAGRRFRRTRSRRPKSSSTSSRQPCTPGSSNARGRYAEQAVELRIADISPRLAALTTRRPSHDRRGR